MILNLPYKVDARGIKIVCVSLERYPQEIYKIYEFIRLPPGLSEPNPTLCMPLENYF